MTTPMPVVGKNRAQITCTFPLADVCGRRFVHAEARDPRKQRLARVVNGQYAVVGMKQKKNRQKSSSAARLPVDCRNCYRRWKCTKTSLRRFTHFQSPRPYRSALFRVRKCAFTYTIHSLSSDRQPKGQYRVIIGEHNNRINEGFEQEFTISNYTLHPDYKGCEERALQCENTFL